jgi:Fur family transcriptional regulator, peroxide stress response regulator
MQPHPEEHKMIDQLRRSRFRATGQRLAVMQVLMESRSHPSAEEIYQTLKRSHTTMPRATVYKTLQLLSNMGALLAIETGTGGQRFDGHLHPHHHAICNKCGRVFDIDFHIYPIDLGKKDILANFKVQGIKVTFTGICHICETLKGKPTAPAASD